MGNNSSHSSHISEGASLSQFFTTFIVAGIIAVIKILAFVIIRTKLKRIYEPKTYLGDDWRRVESLPRTFYGWLPALLRMPQKDLIRTSGLDAYFFARYIYVHGIFFLISFVLIGIVLFPTYLIDGKGEAYGKTGLDVLTFGNISPRASSRFGAPLALAYIFVGAFLYLLYREMKLFVQKRQVLLRSSAYQTTTSSKTILVTGIPKEYMSYDVLFEIFNQFPGGVKDIQFNRNLKNLLHKADQRTELVQKVETNQCRFIKAALKKEAKRQKKLDSKTHSVLMEKETVDKHIWENKRPTMRIGSIPLLSSLFFGKKVDTIIHCKETISELNTEIEMAKTSIDGYAVMNSAFIQFNKSIAAHMAAQHVAASTPLAMTPLYIDVKPTNIIWSNLILTYYEQKFRELMVLVIIAALFFFWTIPVAFVGLLSNITYLTNRVTFLQFIYRLPSPLLGFVTGLLPSFVLGLFIKLLLSILRLLGKATGLPTRDAIDRYVQNSFFIFQVVHSFLIVTISSSLASVVTLIAKDPTRAATILATNVPTSSNFFFSFLVLQGLSITSGLLLQFSTVILFHLLGKLLDNTPRKKWKRHSTLTNLSWGALYPIFTNFIVISVVYSIITPLILLFAGLAFVLCYIAYSYTMFYVSEVLNDSGGLSFPKAIFQSFTGIYLMEVMLAALFFLANNESGSHTAIPEGILTCILIVITIGVQFIMHSSFNSLVHYLPFDAEVFARLQISNDGMSVSPNTVSEITDAVIKSNANTVVNPYIHPVLRDPKPVIWIPQDNLGIAKDELQQIQISGLNIFMSTEGARFNDKIEIEIDGAPPEHQQTTEIDVIQTHF